MTVLEPARQALALRIEHHGLAAWPARAEMDLNGWRVRLSGGFSKRQDCVVPLVRGRCDFHSKIVWCERFYSERHMDCAVRLTDLYDDPLLDSWLLARGYEARERTHVMIKPLASADLPADVALSDAPGDDWVSTAMAVERRATVHADILLHTMQHMPRPKTFARLNRGAETAAIGCAVAGDGLLGIFSMRTLGHHRRQGYGRRILGALQGWGRTQGAEIAWLQVEEANVGAVSLYRSQGFETLYNYCYFIRRD